VAQEQLEEDAVDLHADARHGSPPPGSAHQRDGRGGWILATRAPPPPVGSAQPQIRAVESISRDSGREIGAVAWWYRDEIVGRMGLDLDWIGSGGAMLEWLGEEKRAEGRRNRDWQGGYLQG
jgi:hypothetical protein